MTSEWAEGGPYAEIIALIRDQGASTLHQVRVKQEDSCLQARMRVFTRN